MDPMMLGLLAISGAQNPQAFSEAMSAAGIAPSNAPTPFSYYPTLAESMQPTAGTPQTPPIAAGPQTASPDGAAVAAPAAYSGIPANAAPFFKGLGPFAGVAKPTVPQADMKAGVAGAQAAPKTTPMQHSQQSQLLQLLLHGAAPPMQPTLGALLGR